MLTTTKITRLVIDHIERIEAEEIQEFPELLHSQRSLTIWTADGEKYELVLEAEHKQQLAFDPPADWLSPKLYQGKVAGKEEERDA
jgi:hypothetical protein